MWLEKRGTFSEPVHIVLGIHFWFYIKTGQIIVFLKVHCNVESKPVSMNFLYMVKLQFLDLSCKSKRFFNHENT